MDFYEFLFLFFGLPGAERMFVDHLHGFVDHMELVVAWLLLHSMKIKTSLKWKSALKLVIDRYKWPLTSFGYIWKILYTTIPTPPPYVDLTIYTNQIVLIYIYIYKISKNKLDTSVEI